MGISDSLLSTLSDTGEMSWVQKEEGGLHFLPSLESQWEQNLFAFHSPLMLSLPVASGMPQAPRVFATFLHL